MLLLYVLFAILSTSFSAAVKPTPYVWTDNDNTTEKVVFFPNLDIILVERGKRIANNMVLPTTDDRDYNGKELLEDIFRYNVCVEDAIDFMLSDDEQEKEAGLRVYKAILNVGGPQHLKITPDFELVKSKFEDISPEDIEGIKTSLDELRKLWTRWLSEAVKVNV